MILVKASTTSQNCYPNISNTFYFTSSKITFYGVCHWAYGPSGGGRFKTSIMGMFITNAVKKYGVGKGERIGVRLPWNSWMIEVIVENIT